PRPFRLEILGLPEARLDVAGVPMTADLSTLVEVGPDQTRELRVLVSVPAKQAAIDTRQIRFRLTDVVSGAVAYADDFFKGTGSAP
ncbi:MAG: FixG Ig-like domain-containing protein, partial [Alsobacter sp.]